VPNPGEGGHEDSMSKTGSRSSCFQRLAGLTVPAAQPPTPRNPPATPRNPPQPRAEPRPHVLSSKPPASRRPSSSAPHGWSRGPIATARKLRRAAADHRAAMSRGRSAAWEGCGRAPGGASRLVGQGCGCTRGSPDSRGSSLLGAGAGRRVAARQGPPTHLAGRRVRHRQPPRAAVGDAHRAPARAVHDDRALQHGRALAARREHDGALRVVVSEHIDAGGRRGLGTGGALVRGAAWAGRCGLGKGASVPPAAPARGPPAPRRAARTP
jgi:hypothetical protein